MKSSKHNCPHCKCESDKETVISKPDAVVEVKIIKMSDRMKKSIARGLRLGKLAAYSNEKKLN